MADPAQDLKNHAKMVPLYHYVTFALVIIVLAHAVGLVVNGISFSSIAALSLGLALVLIMLWARIFALGVQDRVIRLEERLRMHEVLPDDLKARINEVPTEALIGLRFASDEELPDLVRRVLAGSLSKRKEIKQAVKNWRPDHQRI